MDCIRRCNMRESWKDLWEFEADLKCPRDKIYYWPYAGGRCSYALLDSWEAADKSFGRLSDSAYIVLHRIIHFSLPHFVILMLIEHF